MLEKRSVKINKLIQKAIKEIRQTLKTNNITTEKVFKRIYEQWKDALMNWKHM